MDSGGKRTVAIADKIISFSLFGQQRLYLDGALANAALVDEVYPGWIARFYVDDTVPAAVVNQLRALKAQVSFVDGRGLGLYFGMYWRFFAAADTSIERFIIRDADSRINHREAAAVQEWIESGKDFHIMRDSIHHTKRIMGGMWGGVGGSIPHIERSILHYGRFDQYADDEAFLTATILPLMAGRYLCHDDRNTFGDARPFPAHRPMVGTSFVGEIVNFQSEDVDVWRELGVFRDKAEQSAREVAELRRLVDDSKALIIHDFRLPDRDSWRRVVKQDGRITHLWGDLLVTWLLLGCLLNPFGTAGRRNRRILLKYFKARV